jgi:hypothetical protein
MSPFTISYRTPTQTLSLSPRGGKAGPTYNLHSRPHTPSLVEELLTSAFRLVPCLLFLFLNFYIIDNCVINNNRKRR